MRLCDVYPSLSRSSIMDAESFIENFRFSGERGFATDADIASIFEVLENGQACARLWNFCGDVIQFSDGDLYSLDDARSCYESAVEDYPDDPEAYESLGFLYDIRDQLEEARSSFILACERTDSDAPRLGLARVLSQLGQSDDALLLLQDCADQQSLDMLTLRNEITDGQWSPDAE